MSDAYAIFMASGQMQFAIRRGSGWQISERIPDPGSGGRRLTVFVDGRDVLTQMVSLPARTEAEARRAAPFSIEDELAVSVEDAHVAISPASSDKPGFRQISAVSHGRMESWLELLSGHGLENAQILPCHAVLPAGDQLIVSGDCILGRIGDRSFTLDREIGPDVIAGLTGSREVQIFGNDLAAALACDASGPGFEWSEEFLVKLADWATAARPAGLRQGRFAVRRQAGLMNASDWRRPTILAAVLAMGWLAAGLLELNGLNQRVGMIESKTQEFARAGWPDSGGDIDGLVADLARTGPRTNIATGPSALTLVAVLYQGLDQVSEAELKSLRFDRAQGRLMARVGFDDFVGIDALTRALQRNGLVVTSGDARQSGSQVIGEIEIGGVR